MKFWAKREKRFQTKNETKHLNIFFRMFIFLCGCVLVCVLVNVIPLAYNFNQKSGGFLVQYFVSECKLWCIELNFYWHYFILFFLTNSVLPLF